MILITLVNTTYNFNNQFNQIDVYAVRLRDRAGVAHHENKQAHPPRLEVSNRDHRWTHRCRPDNILYKTRHWLLTLEKTCKSFPDYPLLDCDDDVEKSRIRDQRSSYLLDVTYELPFVAAVPRLARADQRLARRHSLVFDRRQAPREHRLACTNQEPNVPTVTWLAPEVSTCTFFTWVLQIFTVFTGLNKK